MKKCTSAGTTGLGMARQIAAKKRSTQKWVGIVGHSRGMSKKKKKQADRHRDQGKIAHNKVQNRPGYWEERRALQLFLQWRHQFAQNQLERGVRSQLLSAIRV